MGKIWENLESKQRQLSVNFLAHALSQPYLDLTC